MGQMDEILIRKMAALARLELSPEELAGLRPQLEKIVSYVDRIREIPEAALSAPALPGPVPLREDEPVSGDGQEELSRNATGLVHGHVAVPRVLGSS